MFVDEERVAEKKRGKKKGIPSSATVVFHSKGEKSENGEGNRFMLGGDSIGEWIS